DVSGGGGAFGFPSMFQFVFCFLVFGSSLSLRDGSCSVFGYWAVVVSALLPSWWWCLVSWSLVDLYRAGV
ncbi:hypothetical protein A2U01_0062326, partial [Trifolium medium]|nr:hypothetical protein [Trifolium medium]